MRKMISGSRLIGATGLLALIVAIFIYVDRPLEPEEAVVEKTQEVVNTPEVKREVSLYVVSQLGTNGPYF